MTHPSSLDLEAFACGDSIAAVTAHLGACAACQEFVQRARRVAGSGPSVQAAAWTVRRAQATLRRRAWLTAASIVAPLAAAAAVMLVLRGSAPPELHALRSDAIRSPSAAPSPSPIAEEIDRGTTFKGGPQVAVIRERGGAQARFTSVVRVRPGDRLRVEVALDREQAILGAVVGQDGSYLELMPSSVRGAGTHYSEQSARIDGAPTRGAIVVGSPDAVSRARASHTLEGVASLRVEWEGAP